MGTVVDFLFDETSFKVSWLVVDCGAWSTRHRVLIPPSAISYLAPENQKLDVKLTKAQVESSPEWREHQPVSLQMESRLYEHYGWDPLGGEVPNLVPIPGAMASPLMAPPYFGLQTPDEPATADPVDSHLRSVVEILGYHVHAIDGEIGHVENFLLDAEDWSLRYFIVDTSNWWFGKHVLIVPQAVKAIDWSEQLVEVDASRQQVESSPPWDPLVAFDQIYANSLHEHYGWPGSRA